MPQISPIYWTIIILILILFLSVIISNMPNTNEVINQQNNINLINNTINW